jgi:cell surface protein SprA
MSFSNNQLSEVTNWEYIVGAGYRFENLPIQFISTIGDQKTLKSDLRLRVDFSLRNSKTILRKLAEETNNATQGQRAISVKTSADYVVSEQVTIRLFFDRMINTPFVSTSFPTANTSFGFSVRFTLAQ